MSTTRTVQRWAARISLGLLAIVVAFGGYVYLTLGGGEPYPDVGGAPTSKIEVFAEMELPVGNVTASPQGRVFFDLHPFAGPHRFTDATVFEWVDGEPVPYPDLQTQPELVGALGMTADLHDRLWVVAPAGLEDRPSRLWCFDLRTNTLLFREDLPESAGMFPQDLRVTPDGNTVILADTGAFSLADPAIVVFDVQTRRVRRVLENHPSVVAQPWQLQLDDGPYTLAYGLVTFAVGVDGLAVSDDGQWLYYAAMSHDGLFRVPISVLRDDSADVAAAVERVGTKPLSDGIEIDPEGNVFVTDVEHGGLVRIDPRGQLQTIARSDEVVWADGVTRLPDGTLLFTDSRIPAYIDPLLRPPSRAALDDAAPHRIYAVASHSTR
ncbi:MAG: L-dopachrome tautomerase-related protein [Nannocystaceae bacterium]|nr:major royal jelly family protein [bacterium]